ncbi:MAG: phosphate ABC transporter substrate-binding protein PstS [Microthrixaceae bacterium]|nr:phosphate ABC transporter substrate-binding protein PstS [Microthrixaceae bacterium]
MRASLGAAAVIISLVLGSTGCVGEPASKVVIKVDDELRQQMVAITTSISGGGASFPDAYYQAVNVDFNAIVGSEVVTYAKSGSSDGRAQLGARTLDFAGSDSLPKDDEKLPADLLFFPTVAAPITISYNLPEVPELKLGPETLALIFQAELTTWDAPEIRADNPGVKLPDRPIFVVHRSDGSGTTKNFTTYLSSAAPATWRLGAGDEVSWPRSTQGAEKNSGVAEVIKTTTGAIGYADLGDAAKAELQIARVRNSSGNYMLPSADAVAEALTGSAISPNLTFDPLNARTPGAYPITAPTWILVSASQPASAAESLRVYLRFLLGPAQDQALALGYVPLPSDLAEKANAQIDRISS